MTTRKSPIRHKVRTHKRKGKVVDSFMRGKGIAKPAGQKRRILKKKSYWIKFMKHPPSGTSRPRLNNISVKAISEEKAFEKANKRIDAIEKREGSYVDRDTLRITY